MAEIKEMVAAKKQTAALMGKKYKPRKIKRTQYPVALQVQYRKKIMAMILEMDRLVKKILIPDLDRLNQEARNQRQDAYTYTDDVSELINIIRATHAETYSEAAIQAMAAEQAAAVSGFNRRQMTRAFSNALGVDLFYNEPWLEAEMAAFTKMNVELITSIPQKHFSDIEMTVQRGLRTGRSVRDLTKELNSTHKGSLRMKPRNRAELIARDQTMKLNGDLNHLRQTNIGIKRYIWRTSQDERVRDEHAALEGRIFKWSEPPDVGHPGEDFQCVLSGSPISFTSGVKAGFKRFYAGPVVKITDETGVSVSITPNHPVLTLRGWVFAKDIQNTDKLIKCLDSKMDKILDAEINDRQVSVDDVFNFLKVSGPTQRIAGTAKQFHGDGVDGEIEVVNIPGSLSADVFKTSGNEKIKNCFLPGTHHRKVFFFDDCEPDLVATRNGLAFDGEVRFARLRDSLGNSHARPFEFFRFRLCANADTAFQEPGADNIPAGSEMLRDLILTHAGKIQGFDFSDVEVYSIPTFFNWFIACGVKSISHFNAFCNVFNFATIHEIYLINNIFLGNCRCTAEPIIDV